MVNKQTENHLIELARRWIGTPENECFSGLTHIMTSNPKVKRYAVEELTKAITLGSIDLGLACVKANLLGICDRFPVFQPEDAPDSQFDE